MKKKSVLLLILVVIIATILNCVAFIGFDVAGIKYGGVFDENQGIRKGIDLAGGSVITFEANAENPTEAEMDIVEGIFNTRLNGAGYTEARISRDAGKQITVEIPAVTNTDEAASLLGSTAKLTFRDADGNIVLDGATDIKNAEYQYGQTTESSATAKAYVLVTLNPEAVAKFATATRQAAARTAEGKNYIAIYMDEQMISAPSVQSEINAESCIINGVPRIIQITNFVKRLSGLNFDIAPKAITNPKGKAPTKVTTNNFNVCRNPAFKAGKTMGICSIINSMT